VFNEEVITLECPYCRAAISQPLGWFKQTYATCPACEGGLSSSQFAIVIDEIEQAFDASIDEMILGKPSCGCDCGGGKHGCG